MKSPGLISRLSKWALECEKKKKKVMHELAFTKRGQIYLEGRLEFTQPHSYKGIKGSETNSYLPFTSACQWFFI